MIKIDITKLYNFREECLGTVETNLTRPEAYDLIESLWQKWKKRDPYAGGERTFIQFLENNGPFTKVKENFQYYVD